MSSCCNSIENENRDIALYSQAFYLLYLFVYQFSLPSVGIHQAHSSSTSGVRIDGPLAICLKYVELSYF